MAIHTGAQIARHYGTMQITTASKAKKICMLHDKCIFFITKQDNDFFRRRGNLNQAQNILAQLEASLRRTDETAEALYYLYDYCYSLLERGSVRDQRYALDILCLLRDTFYTQLKKAA